MNRKLRLPLALALALGSSHALALGLGQIEVKSGLYQPLDAQIPVLSTSPGETSNLKVRLASPEDFARVGLDRPSMLSANLDFTVDKDANGKSVIHVRTNSKVNDPFVTFLLEVDWGKGRLLREFTVLLDPPLTAPAAGRAPARIPTAAEVTADRPATVPAVAQPMPEPEAPTPAPAPTASIPAQTSPAPEPVQQQPAPTPAPAPAPVVAQPPMPAAGDYGPVTSGETLWSIASRNRPAGIDMNQTMIALLQANPDAFIGNNINRLKKGAILRIPSASEMAANSIGEAQSQVGQQMDQWRASVGRAQPQPEVADSRRDSAPSSRRTDADRSRLELVPPKGDAAGNSAQSGVAAGSAGTELRRDLQRAKEDLSARDQEIGELKSRVGELEKLSNDSQRLITMKDSELKRLQTRLAELEAADAAASAANDATVDSAANADEMAQPEDSADSMDSLSGAADESTDGAADSSLDAASAPAETPTPVESTPAPARPMPANPATTTPAATQPAAQPADTSRPAIPWYRNLWVMVGGAVLVLGLILLAVMRRGSSGKSKSAPDRRVSDSLAMGATATARDHDDDSMSDREITLLEALSEHPEDLDRHLELVRYYYEQGNEDAFEGAAEAMYAQVADDPRNLAWRQVVAMGREMIPDHPMFEEDDLPAPEPEAIAPVVEEDDFDLALNADTNAASAYTPEVEVDESPSEAESDFNWEAPVADAIPGDSDHSSDISFDDMSPPAPKIAEPAAPPPSAPVAEPDRTPSLAMGGEIDEDAAATKLELARAYLDMGDVEGARGMLEEVLSEGNPGQRDESRRLLDEIR